MQQRISFLFYLDFSLKGFEVFENIFAKVNAVAFL